MARSGARIQLWLAEEKAVAKKVKKAKQASRKRKEAVAFADQLCLRAAVAEEKARVKAENVEQSGTGTKKWWWWSACASLSAIILAATVLTYLNHEHMVQVFLPGYGPISAGTSAGALPAAVPSAATSAATARTATSLTIDAGGPTTAVRQTTPGTTIPTNTAVPIRVGPSINDLQWSVLHKLSDKNYSIDGVPVSDMFQLKRNHMPVLTIVASSAHRDGDLPK